MMLSLIRNQFLNRKSTLAIHTLRNRSQSLFSLIKLLVHSKCRKLVDFLLKTISTKARQGVAYKVWCDVSAAGFNLMSEPVLAEEAPAFDESAT